MTSDIFEKLLLDKMSQDKQKIILFVGNCTGHPRTLFTKLKYVSHIFYVFIFSTEYNK